MKNVHFRLTTKSLQPNNKQQQSNKASYIYSLLVIASLMSNQIFAETKLFSTDIFFDASLGTDLRYVQNANRSITGEDEIDELQIRSDLSLAGAYYGGLISRAQLDYQIYNDRFTDDSQEDQTGVSGEAGLFIGEPKDFYELGLTHSSQRQFVNPEGPDVTDNLTDRGIFTALGALKTRSDLANFARAEISTTQVDYDDFNINDSTRDSLNLSFTRKLNPLTNAGINISLSEVDYDTSDFSDYDYQRASIFFSRNLRRVSYSFDLGQYETEDFSGNTNTGPYANVSLNANYSNFEFFSSIEKDVTDSSLGDSNFNISDTPNIDGQLNIQDQIEREYLLVGFTTKAFCTQCRVSLEWDRESQDYFNLPAENSETESLSFEFKRNISSKLSVNINLRQLDFSFIDTANTGNFKEKSIQTSLNFKNTSKRFFTSLYAELLERTIDQQNTYESPSIGVSLSYTLY